jgi:photosystem II stability/assembly factor-like uncharacterized protein
VRHVLVDPTDPKRVYASAGPAAADGAGHGLYRSEDAGEHWVQVSPGRVGAVQSASICSATGTIYALANRDNAGWGGFWAERDLLRSDDHGKTWLEVTVKAPHGACVAVHPKDPNRVYFLGFADDVRTQEVNVWRSTDGGRTWESIANDTPLSPGGYGNKIVFDPTNPDRFFVLHDSGTYEAVEH